MKVSEVKGRIADLRRHYGDMARLHEYFNGRAGAEDCDEVREKLESGAGLSCGLCDLITDVTETLYNEIRRLEKAIDDADIQV